MLLKLSEKSKSSCLQFLALVERNTVLKHEGSCNQQCASCWVSCTAAATFIWVCSNAAQLGCKQQLFK